MRNLQLFDGILQLVFVVAEAKRTACINLESYIHYAVL